MGNPVNKDPGRCKPLSLLPSFWGQQMNTSTEVCPVVQLLLFYKMPQPSKGYSGL